MVRVSKEVRSQARGFFKEAILLLPRVGLLLSRLIRDARISKIDKILVGAVAAYVITPIDLIYDFIPLVGQVDDLFAVSVVLMRLVANSGEEVVKEHWTGKEDLVPWIQRVAGFSRVFLPDTAVRSILDRFGR